MTTTVFSYPLTIKEHHLDTFGHVNNAMYLTILEEARWELITQNGYGLKKIQKTGIGPIVLEIKLIFLKELLLRETVIIETQLISYEKKVGKIAQKIMRNNEVCCTAEFAFGLFNMHERKLILPTPEWLNAVGAYTK